MKDLKPFIDPLVVAYGQRGTFTPGDVVPETVAEAYAVHAALIEAVGPAGGFKVSQKPGQDPVVAPIPASRCLPSGAFVETPAAFGVELEVGFVVTGPVPDPDAPDFRAQLCKAVRPAPMIELVATRIDGPLADDPVVKLADLQACEALVSGEMLGDWRGADFEAPDVEFGAGAETIFSGAGSVPGGSAIGALEAAIRALGGRFGGLQPGQRLLTGTLVPLTPLRTDQVVKGRVAGLGEVVARV